MRHHRSILAALVVSLLLVGSSIAAPRRVSTQFFMYLPHIDTSAPCTVSWPPEVPLVLPAFILAFLDAGDIWLFHPTTRSVERLTQDTNISAFAWSPDATRIVFTSLDPRSKATALKVVRLADHRVTTLIGWTDGRSPGNPTWSPDGKRIAFDMYFYDGVEEHSSIMVMQANGTQVQQLRASGYDFDPDWSPDGRWIAFISMPNLNDLGTLYVMNADGTNPTPLTDGLWVTSRLAWSPDGTRIAFTGYCTEGGVTSGLSDIFMIAAGGEARTPLAAPGGAGPNQIGDWSPDGRQFVYEQTYGHGSFLAVINVDGSGYSILPINGSRAAWAPR